MYNSINDFANDWKYESESTLKIFSALQDSMLTTKVHERVRTAGILAWHITHTLKEMMERSGLVIDLKHQESYNGETVAELVASYKQASESLLTQITSHWTDTTLQQEDNMYGEMWKRGITLSVLIHHQIHHRGQLEVIMRICGLRVPGIYGPANEEWAAMGMPAME